MSKLINLNNQLIIPADSINKITGVYQSGNHWYCTIGYKLVDGDREFHTYSFNKTFVTTEDSAKIALHNLIDRINELR